MGFYQYLGQIFFRIFLQSWTTLGAIPNLITLGAVVIWVHPSAGGFMKNLPRWIKKYSPRVVVVLYLVGILIYVPYSLNQSNVNKIESCCKNN